MPNPNMHLLDVTMFWSTSGGVRRYIDAKHRWAQRHTAWTHSVATPMWDDATTVRIPALPLPGSGGAYRLPWRRTASARLLREARPDLIEAGDPYRLAWAALDAADALRVPPVAFCHSNLEALAAEAAGPHFGRAAQRAVRRYAQHLYSQFELVLAPSRAMTAHLRDWGIARVVHQPLGVDTATFHPRRRNPRWRASLALPEGARLLVYAGRFAPEKNLELLEAALRRLGPRYWLLAVGSGAARPHGDRVITVSALSEPALLATLLASSDLFVHAGAQETFGLAALEALACGLPVVARRAEGLAELVDDSVGRAVERPSAEDFAAAIADVLDGGTRASLGAAARRRAEASDWERVLPGLARRYLRVLGSDAVL
ncbi:MAG TPA: glycosyltransferase [Burkholderiaceae bacterium]|nr:glycosyltransferase [Burkholderiaceae bacterium]